MAPRNQTEATLAQIWQALFGLDAIGVRDDFFELGGHSLLATQLLNRVRKSFPSAGRLSLAMLFDGPTIEELAGHIELTSASAGSEPLPSMEHLAGNSPEQRRTFFHDYLAARAATPFDIAPAAAQILWDLKRDFGLVLYPYELRAAACLEDLVDRVAAAAAGPPPPDPNVKPADFRTCIVPSVFPTSAQPEPNPTMVFVLSAPRSGSTLLRLMLAGHPGLFCPPELALLSAPDMTNWRRHQAGMFELDGLTRALMELRGIEASQARGHIERLTEIQQAYRELQAACGDRVLVDKSPAYALDARILARAEALFSHPRYLILPRHPCSVIDSMVRHRIEHLLAAGAVTDPWRFAELVWSECNLNLERLCSSVPQRCHRLAYEDLVSRPAQAMRGVSAFLELEYNEAMLNPYAGGRMIDGPGDPDIFQHDRIEADLADVWRRIPLPFTLQPETSQLAARLGFQIPQAGMPLDPPPAPAESAVDLAVAARVFKQVNTLSDDEVEAALKALLPGKEQDS